MANWTHQICERCWFDGPGRGLFGSVRVPVQVIGGNGEVGVGTCHFCLLPCVTAIFVRHKPQPSCDSLHDPDE